MSDTVTYNCGRAGTAILQKPTVTVAHNTEVSRYRQFTVLVRITYTIRALIAVANSPALKAAMEHYRTVLSISGGVFTADYGNDQDFLEAKPSTDITGGPHPTFLDIRELHGGKSAIVTWTLQTEKHVKDDAVNAVGAWLDFVYTISTSLNSNFYATRTISGILRLSSCHSQTRYRSADAFRQTVERNIAPVPTTGVWQRVSREFRLSEDQKILAFTIVDSQLYTLLPYGITSGDMSLTTIAEKYGHGRYILRGWFEASPSLSRGVVQGHVKEIWQLFFNLVVQRIEAETTGEDQWKITNERRSYVVHWRSNRVEFEAVYEILGLWERGIPDNIEYTVNRALDWLAYLSRKYNRSIADEGPYGSALVLGPSGQESPGPVVLIDPMEKLPAGFAYGPGVGQPFTGGDKTNVPAGTTSRKSYTTWHQSFKYMYDSGKVFIPVKAANQCDVVQQTKNISVYLVVVGEAERVGIGPEVPLYPHKKLLVAGSSDTIITGVPQLILVSSDVVAHEPSPAGVYRVTWKQIYKFHNVGMTIPLKWPYTPLNEDLGDKALVSVPGVPL